jgi:hypothetical protein
MRRLILAGGLAATLMACGSTKERKKDAGSLARDTGTNLTADSAAASDATKDAGPAADGSPTDLAADVPTLDSSIPDGAEGDVGTADAALIPDAGPDVAGDSAHDSASDGMPDSGSDAVAMCGRVSCDCKYKGKNLYGRYRVDDIFYDFKVREVTFNEDLKVEKVDFAADRCGKWQRDDIFYDFRIRLVDFNEDFSIRYVTFSPGLP